MHCICVLGTDTEIGKTYVTAQLADALVRRGEQIGVYKPAASGIPLGSGESDADLLRAAAQLNVPIERVCPQCFVAPLAPPVAAGLEGKRVDEALLVDGAKWWRGQCQLLLVEGAGGALSPISEHWTCLDLALQLASVADTFQLLLVTQHRLGMVNQVLLALEAIRSRRLPILGVYVNQLPVSPASPIPNAQDVPPAAHAAAGQEPPSLLSNLELLRKFAGPCEFFTDIEPLATLLSRDSPQGQP